MGVGAVRQRREGNNLFITGISRNSLSMVGGDQPNKTLIRGQGAG